MPRTYMVPINEAVDGGSQTVDVVELQGTKKQRLKQWRAYLRVRCGLNDVHKMNQVTRDLGFEEIIK